MAFGFVLRMIISDCILSYYTCKYNDKNDISYDKNIHFAEIDRKTAQNAALRIVRSAEIQNNAQND